MIQLFIYVSIKLYLYLSRNNRTYFNMKNKTISGINGIIKRLKEQLFFYNNSFHL